MRTRSVIRLLALASLSLTAALTVLSCHGKVQWTIAPLEAVVIAPEHQP